MTTSKPDLATLIADAIARGPMTPEERAAQRRGYLRAEMSFGSDKDEADRAAALVAGDTETLARLDREAKARADAADLYCDAEGI